jgi:hypothetical protein
MTEQEFRSKYPPEIIELMLQRQQEQGNPKNIKPFLETISRDKKMKGFSWINTIEGFEFWHDVLKDKDFKIFYNLYPKKRNFKILL